MQALDSVRNVESVSDAKSSYQIQKEQKKKKNIPTVDRNMIHDIRRRGKKRDRERKARKRSSTVQLCFVPIFPEVIRENISSTTQSDGKLDYFHIQKKKKKKKNAFEQRSFCQQCNKKARLQKFEHNSRLRRESCTTNNTCGMRSPFSNMTANVCEIFDITISVRTSTSKRSVNMATSAIKNDCSISLVFSM